MAVDTQHAYLTRSPPGLKPGVRRATFPMIAVGILSGHLSREPGIARAYYLRPIIDGLNLKVCGDC